MRSARNGIVLLGLQVLVVIPPGAASNAHPIFALQLGAATACAPPNRCPSVHYLTVCFIVLKHHVYSGTINAQPSSS